jgi:hypothetical protein
MATLHRVWIVVTMMSVIAALSHLWVLHSAVRPPQAIVLHAAEPTTSVIDAGLLSSQTRADDWAEPRVDLNGNEIDEAVGDYRVDTRGDMYERHAPDTALLHLSAPSL